MAAELYAVLEEAQTWKEDQYVCPKSAARYNKVDRNGKSVGVNLINIDVLRVIRWIGLEPSVAVPGRSIREFLCRGWSSQGGSAFHSRDRL